MDTDDIIALRENMSVKDIFESKGENILGKKKNGATGLINRDKIAISAGGAAACADLLEYALWFS